MQASTYQERRGQIERYFDRTAMKAWEQLTSTAPVGRIRATVRAGRDRMRDTLLSWLPDDLHGARILDAGCGTGAFAMAAAQRGADVLAIDLSPALVDVAMRRSAEHPRDRVDAGSRITWRSGDFTDPALGHFDYVVATRCACCRAGHSAPGARCSSPSRPAHPFLRRCTPWADCSRAATARQPSSPWPKAGCAACCPAPQARPAGSRRAASASRAASIPRKPWS
jgi:SAM-dependent methyltransferase